VYEEIAVEDISEDDFIITNMTPEVKEEVVEEQKTIQADLLFDLPLNSYEEIKPTETKVEETETRFELTQEILNLEVTDAVEVVVEKEKVVEKRYTLEEDFDVQPTIGKSSSIVKEEEVSEEEMQIELKSAPQAEVNEIVTDSEEVSPLSLTISELQKRAEERRQKMKGFNYKFTDQMNKNIDEIERQPAYKRLGVNLDETDAAISKSKTTLSTDENDDIQLRSNNSFLHDNVD
jgi:cell division protein FtsZ